MLAACLAGRGIAQLLDFHPRERLADGSSVHMLPEWADETYPLHAYHHPTRPMSATGRALLDFVRAATCVQEAAARTSFRAAVAGGSVDVQVA